MKLYFAPNSRAVRIAWLLEELGITYEIEKYSVGDKALRTPEFYKLHPMGRVPVLEDKEVTIYESGAILEYLLAKYDNGIFFTLVFSSNHIKLFEYYNPRVIRGSS